MKGTTQIDKIMKLLLDVAREEKIHIGEFQTLLLIGDWGQEKELKEGRREVKELMKLAHSVSERIHSKK